MILWDGVAMEWPTGRATGWQGSGRRQLPMADPRPDRAAVAGWAAGADRSASSCEGGLVRGEGSL
jgi:hypothetical protein